MSKETSNYGNNWGWADAVRAIGWRGILGMLVRLWDEPVRGFSPYYWVTALDVAEETAPGWFTFHWRPIRGSTFRNYVFSGRDFRWIPKYRAYSTSGYNYCHKARHGEIEWGPWEINFWICWDFSISEDGPVDWDEPAKPRLKGQYHLRRIANQEEPNV